MTDDLFYASYAALWALVVLQGLIALGSVRAIYRLGGGVGLDTLPLSEARRAGEPVPEFAALDLDGRLIDEHALTGHRSALLFVSPDCSSCSATLNELGALMLKVDGRVIVVCRAGRTECRRLAEKYGIDVPVVVDEDRSLSEVFGVSFTPTAVLVGSSGVVDTYGHPLRGDDLERLWSGELQEAH